MKTKHITHAALIGAAYAALTLVLAPISYAAVQLRLSEALTVLPILTPAAVPGLFVGVLIANALGPFSLIDMVCGSLLTLAAALLTRWWRKWPALALLPPVLLNGLGVPLYLYFILKVPAPVLVQVNRWLWLPADADKVPSGAAVLSLPHPYLAMALSITIGQAVAVYGLGFPLLMVLRKFARQLLED